MMNVFSPSVSVSPSTLFIYPFCKPFMRHSGIARDEGHVELRHCEIALTRYTA